MRREKQERLLLIWIITHAFKHGYQNSLFVLFFRDENLLLPVEIQKGGIETILIRLKGVFIEYQIYLPGQESRPGNGAQIFRHGKFFLPSKFQIYQQEKEWHQKNQHLSKKGKDSGEGKPQTVSTVCRQSFLFNPFYRSLIPRNITKGIRTQQHLHLNKFILRRTAGKNYLPISLDNGVIRRVRENISHLIRNQRNSHIPVGDMIARKHEIDMDCLIVIFNWRIETIGVGNSVSSRFKITQIQYTNLVIVGLFTNILQRSLLIQLEKGNLAIMRFEITYRPIRRL